MAPRQEQIITQAMHLVPLTNRFLSQLPAPIARLAPYAMDAAAKTGIPASLLLAVTGQESNYGQNEGPSSAGAQGVGQFIPDTRQTMIQKYGVDPWKDDRSGIMATALYLKELGAGRDPASQAQALHRYSGGYAAGAYDNPIIQNAQNFKALDRLSAAHATLARAGLKLVHGGIAASPAGAKAMGLSPAQAAQQFKGHYMNPFGSPTEIDQGVDYATNGPLGAIGKSKVVDTGSSTFGGGPFLGFQLLKGPRKGWTYYIAEGVQPRSGLRPGDVVKKGDVIANETGPIEAGWAAKPGVPYSPSQTLAQVQYGGAIPDAVRHAGDVSDPKHSGTAAGRDFYAFLQGKPGTPNLSTASASFAGGGGSYGGIASSGAVGGAGAAAGAPSSRPIIQTTPLTPPLAVGPTFPSGFRAPQVGGVTQPAADLNQLFKLLQGAPELTGRASLTSPPGGRRRRSMFSSLFNG